MPDSLYDAVAGVDKLVICDCDAPDQNQGEASRETSFLLCLVIKRNQMKSKEIKWIDMATGGRQRAASVAGL